MADLTLTTDSTGNGDLIINGDSSNTLVLNDTIYGIIYSSGYAQWEIASMTYHGSNTLSR